MEIFGPIYRAQKLGSKEYVEGYLLPPTANGKTQIMTSVKIPRGFFNSTHYVDPTTLAISFPDMTNIKGQRIFASLSEGGFGGDILRSKYSENEDVVYVYKKGQFTLLYKSNTHSFRWTHVFNSDYNTIGIFEGDKDDDR